MLVTHQFHLRRYTLHKSGYTQKNTPLQHFRQTCEHVVEQMVATLVFINLEWFL